MIDLLLNSNQELEVMNGDFVVGECTLQNQDLLIMTFKGEWKENPTIAVGAAGYLKDENENALMAEIKTQFEKDGMVVNGVAIVDEKLITDAHY